MAQKLQNSRLRSTKGDGDDRQASEEEFGSEEDASVEEGAQIVDVDSDAAISGQESSDEEAAENYQQQISSVSFGALKEAHDAISRKRKRGANTNADQEDKLAALRDRLRQIKEQKVDAAAAESKGRTKLSTSESPGRNQDTGADSDSDSESGPSEEGAPSRSRTSKHAPTAQSTRYQVSRKRQVVDVPKRNVRDPRFDAFQRHAHSGTSDKAYSFLQDYQRDEIKELRAEIKRTKSEEDKEVLRRKVNSMENRLKAKAAKDREQEVLRRHRKEERAKVEEGKTPYYLKQKEIKEQALVEKFKGMKSKDRQKLIDKRQKKESQKEKKRMPAM